MTYTAQVRRENSLWVIEVPGIGVTQAKALNKVSHMARALISDLLDLPYESIEVTTDIQLPDTMTRKVRALRRAMEQAEKSRMTAAEQNRQLIEWLTHEGLPGNDIASILNVTPARVSQLRNNKASSKNYRSKEEINKDQPPRKGKRAKRPALAG